MSDGMDKRAKGLMKRAYYKKRRKARLAAQHVMEDLLARVDAAIDVSDVTSTSPFRRREQVEARDLSPYNWQSPSHTEPQQRQ